MITARYHYETAITQPAKTTVTAIRRRVADEGDNEARRVFQDASLLTRTRKLDSKLTAAEIGTAHHTFLQFVTLKRTATELDLRNEAAILERNRILSPEQVLALDFPALAAFWQSDLGKEIRALPETVVNREMPFTARFQVSEIESLLRPGAITDDLTLKPESDFVVVQGIADLAVLLPEAIWLLDFKTDHVGDRELPAKVEHYKPQLKIYAIALARIFGRPVTRCWLHFLVAQKTVPLEPAA